MPCDRPSEGCRGAISSLSSGWAAFVHSGSSCAILGRCGRRAPQRPFVRVGCVAILESSWRAAPVSGSHRRRLWTSSATTNGAPVHGRPCVSSSDGIASLHSPHARRIAETSMRRACGGGLLSERTAVDRARRALARASVRTRRPRAQRSSARALHSRIVFGDPARSCSTAPRAILLGSRAAACAASSAPQRCESLLFFHAAAPIRRAPPPHAVLVRAAACACRAPPFPARVTRAPGVIVCARPRRRLRRDHGR